MPDTPDIEATEALQAVYATSDANSPITLYDGPMIFTRDGERIQGNGAFSLEWIPFPQFRFCMRSERQPSRDMKLALDLAFAFSGNKKTDIELSDIGQTVPVCGAGAGHVLDSQLEISGTMENGEIITGSPNKLSALVFHLPNVPSLLCSPDRVICHIGKGVRTWDRLVLRCDKWKVTLDPVENEDDLLSSVAAARGYAITRVGRLERMDGKTFSLEKSRAVLEVLTYLLSFAFERWCSPVLAVGLNRSGQRVCELWTPCRLGRFQSHLGWFDPHHPVALSDLFPVLYERWKDKEFREALKDAIYWFIEIHRQPIHIDTGIVLGQTTLEMLGWLLLVESKRIVSEDGFKSLPAADKLKLLLSSSSIPSESPPELGTLHKLAKAKNWQGPDGLVTVRNAIVHRNKRKREQLGDLGETGDALWDAYRLVCWYIELVILRQLGYEGRYSNRLRNRRMTGQTDPVPWAKAVGNGPSEGE